MPYQVDDWTGGIPYTEAEDSTSRDRQTSRDDGRSARTPRVLVVDDYPDTREILTEVLVIRGFRVETAENGIEALEKTRSWRPDIVILDLSLPDLDGFEVCRRVRSDPGLRDLPVVAYTAFTDDERRERAMAAGCTTVLIKPTPPAVLVETLRNLIRANQPRTAEPDPDDSWVRLAASRAAYRQSLPQRGAELARVWLELRDSEGAHRQGLQSLSALTHRLVGSSGTYGFPEVSRLAGKLERALEEYLERQSAGAGESVDRLVEELARLTVRQGSTAESAPEEHDVPLRLDPGTS